MTKKCNADNNIKGLILEADKLVDSINTKEDADNWVKQLCQQFKVNENYKCNSSLCSTCILKDFNNLMKFVLMLELERKLN